MKEEGEGMGLRKWKKVFHERRKEMNQEDLSFVSGGISEEGGARKCACGGSMVLVENYGDGTALYKCMRCGEITTEKL